MIRISVTWWFERYLWNRWGAPGGEEASQGPAAASVIQPAKWGDRAAVQHYLLVNKTLSCIFRRMTFRKLGHFSADIVSSVFAGPDGVITHKHPTWAGPEMKQFTGNQTASSQLQRRVEPDFGDITVERRCFLSQSSLSHQLNLNKMRSLRCVESKKHMWPDAVIHTQVTQIPPFDDAVI